MLHYNRAIIRMLSLGLLVGMLTGCASTRIVQTWSAPDQPKPFALTKVVTLAIHPLVAVRNLAEDETARHIGADRATAGNKVIGEDLRRDTQALRAKLLELGFDGAVLQREIGGVEQPFQNPGTADESFTAQYDKGLGLTWGTAEVSRESTTRIQTSIYSLKEGRLLWRGVSDSIPPSSVPQLVDEVAKSVGEQLRKEGFVK